jgi:hypothetical protein
MAHGIEGLTWRGAGIKQKLTGEKLTISFQGFVK